MVSGTDPTFNVNVNEWSIHLFWDALLLYGLQHIRLIFMNWGISQRHTVYRETHFPSLFHLHFKQVQTSFCVVHKTDTGDDQVRDSTAYQEGICWIQQSLRTSCGFKTQMLTFSSFESPSAFTCNFLKSSSSLHTSHTSQPPEAYVHNQHDEEDSTRS